MSKRIEIAGEKFYRLLVIEFSHVDRYGQAYWRCKCDCGNIIVTSGNNIRRGHATSCGCFRKEQGIKINTVHGKCTAPEYIIWRNMKSRCLNKLDQQFRNYGGRGINFCSRWQTFKNFYKDMGPRPSKNYSIERIDNDKGYSPGNCKWATKSEQSRNKRNTILITYKGLTKCLADWSEEKHWNVSVIRGRLKRGWTVEKTFEIPVGYHQKTWIKEQHETVT